MDVVRDEYRCDLCGAVTPAERIMSLTWRQGDDEIDICGDCFSRPIAEIARYFAVHPWLHLVD